MMETRRENGIEMGEKGEHNGIPIGLHLATLYSYIINE